MCLNVTQFNHMEPWYTIELCQSTINKRNLTLPANQVIYYRVQLLFHDLNGKCDDMWSVA